MPRDSAPQKRHRSTFSKLEATYKMSPFKVRVPPKRIMERIPIPLRGAPGIQALANHKPRVFVRGRLTVITTRAQYPYPATAAPIAREVLAIREPTSIHAKVVKRIWRCRIVEC